MTVNNDATISRDLVQDGSSTACASKSEDLKPDKVNFVLKAKVKTVSSNRLDKELHGEGKPRTEKVTKGTANTHKIIFTEAELEKIINNLAKRSMSDE